MKARPAWYRAEGPAVTRLPVWPVRQLPFLAVLLAMLAASAPARADSCSVTMSDMAFAAVSPISASDNYASASGTVKCTWNLLAATPPYLLLFPNVRVCINLGVGSNSTGAAPRTLGNGAARLDYNLYRDSTYTEAALAGGPALPGTSPVVMNLTAPNLLTGGNINGAFTLHGKIPAGASLRAAQTVNNEDTVYSSSFAGAATVSYAFYNLIAPACTSGASASFAFQVQATVVNNCTINASALNFGSGNVINGTTRAQGSLSVQCVNNNAYQIKLNGGSVAANVTARQMKRVGGAERLNYQLSSSLDGPVWGDGTAGTAVVSGMGSGQAVAVPVYGRVPAQTSPAPGSYSDTITATIVF